MTPSVSHAFIPYLCKMTSPASFTDFAETISANARIIDEFLNSNSAIPRPSFAPDGPIGFPCPPQITHIHAAREALLDASKKLYQLALGPVESLFELAVRVCIGLPQSTEHSLLMAT